jgi:4-hydroxybenzoate polyprenyltransferase
MGTILEWKVWFFSFLFFGGGMVILSLLGNAVSKFSLALLGNIVLYNVFHKQTVLAPIVMALCRLFLIIMAAAAGGQIEVEGFTLWCAVALAAYIVGLSFIASKENGGTVRLWPCVLLFSPMVLAFIVNDASFGQRGLVVALILGFWIVRCLRWVFGVNRKSVPDAVSGLLAGIVLVDLTAIGPVYPEMVIVFPILFLVSLLLQRIAPAT